MFSRTLFPDTSLGEDTTSFTCCDFTLVNTPLVTDSFCFSCPFSSSVRPNCSHQFETAPYIVSWFTEWMIRNKSSVFEASSLKCMVSLFFLFVQGSTTQSSDTLEYWMTSIFESLHHSGDCRILFSFRCFTDSSTPLLFVSRTEDRPEPYRGNLFAYSLTFAEFEIQIPSFPFLVQSMSLNIDM